jgi:hypothetical protein
VTGWGGVAVAVDPAQVAELVAIGGFPEDQVRLALQATNGDPNTAYELLASGMPVRGRQRETLGDGNGPSLCGTPSGLVRRFETADDGRSPRPGERPRRRP